jgi:hypothetical protein
VHQVNPGLFDLEGKTHNDSYYKMQSITATFYPTLESDPFGLIRMGFAAGDSYDDLPVSYRYVEGLGGGVLSTCDLSPPESFENARPLRFLSRMGTPARDDCCKFVIETDAASMAPLNWGTVSLQLRYLTYHRFDPLDSMDLSTT